MKKIIIVMLMTLLVISLMVSCDTYSADVVEEADDGVVLTLKGIYVDNTCYTSLYDNPASASVDSIEFKNVEGKTLSEIVDGSNCWVGFTNQKSNLHQISTVDTVFTHTILGMYDPLFYPNINDPYYYVPASATFTESTTLYVVYIG